MRIDLGRLKIIFYGTRGLVDVQSKKHHNHTSILIKSPKTSVLLDRGEDNPPERPFGKVDFELCSHCHPDHILKLQKFVASEETKKRASKLYPKKTFNITRVFKSYIPFYLGDIKFLPIPVYHSLKCPMHAFIIKYGGFKIWIATDFLGFHKGDFKKYFKDIDLAIIDGSFIERTMIRKKDSKVFGHESIFRQIGRMQYQAKSFVITHLGTKAIRIGNKKLAQKIKEEFPTAKFLIANDE